MIDYLVEVDDVLNADIQVESEFKDIALKLSIDMFSIHQHCENDAKDRFQHLVSYFEDRQGVWDEDAGNEHQMAVKMFMMGLLAEDLYPAVCGKADVDHTAFNIKFTIESENEISVAVGIHRDLPLSKNKVVSKLIDIHLRELFVKLKSFDFMEMKGFTTKNASVKFTNPRELYSDLKNKTDIDAEIDDETGRALQKLSWDKTVKGEA